MNKDRVVIFLELAAAEAKALAENVKSGRTWPGDIQQGVANAKDALTKALRESGDRDE